MILIETRLERIWIAYAKVQYKLGDLLALETHRFHKNSCKKRKLRRTKGIGQTRQD